MIISFNNVRVLLNNVLIKFISVLTVLLILLANPIPYGAGITPFEHFTLHFTPLITRL
jgi:hypothetical protein